ncbi:large ribosomal subunit protein mL64-like [Watersipora subatra]|uniref:large ribosomal subunit protein mL64-like n=1 Tax=Watersipora subatra TaxID=2589382 RepID=UPI00355C763F
MTGVLYTVRCRFFISTHAHKAFVGQFRRGLANESSNIDDDLMGSTDASTDISRLKPRLHKRLKNIPIEWSLPESHLAYSSLDYGKSTNEIAERHRTRIERKSYARFGRERVTIDLPTLWPSAEEIKREKAKLEFFKPVAERIEDIRAENKAKQEEFDTHQRRIEENMAKMDEYMAQYRRRKTKKVEKDVEQIRRSEELLVEAREFFGYDIDRKDIKFQQMVEWKEEQAKRAKRKLKREKKENMLAHQVAQLTADLGSSQD